MISRKLSVVFVGFFFLMSSLACEKDEPVKTDVFQLKTFDALPVVKSNNIKTYAHYMPWFETPETNNGNWGVHWKMATKNPNNTDVNGKREIASHYYPLSGPYASSDPDIIEYHLLLMKYSGIDGVLIDWYGSTDYNDYGSNRINSEALIDQLEKVGLDYAIVYEDRTIEQVVKKDGNIGRIEAAQNDMLYMEEEYFDDNNYIYVKDAPLLLNFGPIEFHKPSEWEEIFGVLSEVPTFLPLNYAASKAGAYASGEYIWVDNGSLNAKYERKNSFEVFMGGAYPGFHDFYGEGGWGESFDWSIEHKNGDTFYANLQKAKAEKVDYLQLITWNDYGEGTMIEPTEEFGFTMLEHVQDFSDVSYSKADLEQVFNLYQLRKEVSKNSDKLRLDQAFYYLVSLQNEKAYALLDSLRTTL